MDVKNYSEARSDLARLMDKVTEDREPVIITRRNGRPVVMISLDEWNSWQETEYLNRSPANREAVRQAEEESKRGEGRLFASAEEAIEAAKREAAKKASTRTSR